MPKPVSMPINAASSPASPDSTPLSPKPAIRPVSTSQFGMRRVRRSQIAATSARTRTTAMIAGASAIKPIVRDVMEHFRIPPDRILPRWTGRRLPVIALAVIALLILVSARWGASLLIDYEWWKEIGQVHTWIDYYTYQTVPVAIGIMLAAFVLWWAHHRAVKFSGTNLKEHPLYSRLTTLAAILLGWIIASANIDNWTIMRYIGSRSLPAASEAWHDPVFNRPLHFYL